MVPRRCCLPEQVEKHGGMMGDAQFPAHSLLPYPKPGKCPLCGETSFSSCLFYSMLLFFPPQMCGALQLPMALGSSLKNIHPGAVGAAPSRLVPFGAWQGRVCPHGCTSSSVCPAVPVQRQGTLSQRPPCREGS